MQDQPQEGVGGEEAMESPGEFQTWMIYGARGECHNQATSCFSAQAFPEGMLRSVLNRQQKRGHQGVGGGVKRLL